MPFSTTQIAAGQSAVTDLIAYDSLGMSVQVRLTVVMESRDNTNTTYRWFADCPDNQNGVDSKIACGTGLIMFDGEGNFTTRHRRDGLDLPPRRAVHFAAGI